MKVSKELKDRIRQLENEQNRQQDDLADLDSLRNLVEIEALEKELVDIHQDQSSTDILSTLDDIDLDFENKLENANINIGSNRSSEIHDIDLSELEKLEDENSISKQKGYIVCLLFNQDKPSEWSEESGGGWRGPNMGTRYATKAKAQAVAQQLKQKWPDYPIQIFN